MSDEIVGALIALGGVFAGLIVTGVLGYLQQIQATRANFTEAVRYFEKGTQRRSIGIALISQAIKTRALRRESLSVLVGSAIYLLTESEQGNKQHELHNLDRIFDLVEKYGKVLPANEIQALRNAFERKGGLYTSEGDREENYQRILNKL